MACLTLFFLPLFTLIVAPLIQATCYLYNVIWQLKPPLPLEQQMISQSRSESFEQIPQQGKPSNAATNPYATPIAVATPVIDQSDAGIRVPTYPRALGLAVLWLLVAIAVTISAALIGERVNNSAFPVTVATAVQFGIMWSTTALLLEMKPLRALVITIAVLTLLTGFGFVFLFVMRG